MHFNDELASADAERLFRSLSPFRRGIEAALNGEPDAERRSQVEHDRDMLRDELLLGPVARSEIVVRLTADLVAFMSGQISSRLEPTTASLIQALIDAPGTVKLDKSDTGVPTAVLDAAEQAGANRRKVAREMGWAGDEAATVNAVPAPEPYGAAEAIVRALDPRLRIGTLILTSALLCVYSAVWRSPAEPSPTE